MNQFSNSAKRILNILISLQGKSHQTSAAQTWAGILGIDESIVNSDPYELNQKLTLIRDELNLVEKGMDNSKFSDELYMPYINQLKLLVSPNNLAAAWANYAQYINPETILSIKYCSEILDNEDTVDFKELSDLLIKIDEFRKSLNQTKLDEDTYQFILNQISIIEKAIKNYPITGNAAIKKAFKEGMMDIIEKNNEIDNINAGENIHEKKELFRIWEKLHSIGKAVVEGDKIATALINLCSKGQSLSDTATKLLS